MKIIILMTIVYLLPSLVVGSIMLLPIRKHRPAVRPWIRLVVHPTEGSAE